MIGRITLNLLQNQSYHMLFHMTGRWVASGVRNSKLLPLTRDTFLLHNRSNNLRRVQRSTNVGHFKCVVIYCIYFSKEKYFVSKAKLLSVQRMVNIRTHVTIVQRHEAEGNFCFDTRRATLFISLYRYLPCSILLFQYHSKGSHFLNL